MAHDLDLAAWPRRASYEHFRSLARPWWGSCVRLDLTALWPLRQRLPGGLSLAYHHRVLRQLNAMEPFRLRLRGDRVHVLDAVHGSMTVLRPDETIAFAHLRWHADLATFAAAAEPGMRAVQRGEVGFGEEPEQGALAHFTTLPWLDFSSFTHARGDDVLDATPKFAFGRIVHDGGRATMAMAVDVHHALVDGLHVGRFVQALQADLDDAARWVP